ncbi:MAG: ATP-binding cassette domain-containing protein [Gammaproteobacteria bacterium]|nr:ATP-binding cassette domain-containing protein [Gammaproteobacteria bacterium]
MLLNAEKVGRSFGETRALEDVSFQLDNGQMLAVVGPDGAGKTTLMLMLTAILDPTAGRCTVFGFDSVKQSAEITDRIGYMSQNFSLYDRLTVEENLAFSAGVRGIKGAEYQARRAQLLEMAGLSAFADRYAGKLSGGMRKKLSLCTNLIHQPELLVLDEPGLGVDPLSRRELWQILAEFQRQGTAMVIATSYMDEAENCGHVLMLDQGKIVAEGSPIDLKKQCADKVFELSSAQPGSLYSTLSSDPAVNYLQWLPTRLRFQVDALERLAAATQEQCRLQGELTAVEPTLEDVFVHFTGADQGNQMVPSPAPARLLEIGKPVISTHGLTARFGGFTAVDTVSLNLHAGEIIALVGPNGAGKTTLIRLLCGLLAPAAGELEVAAVDVRRKPQAIRSYVGYMSQSFSLYSDLSAAENMAFFAGAYRLGGKKKAASITAVSRMTGIDGIDQHQRAGSLSGAIRQRLALACAILHEPKVLFLDEPTSGVDPLSRYHFWQLIQLLASRGVAVLVTTHYLSEAAYCDRIGLMDRGRLLACGTLQTLCQEARLAEGTSLEDVFIHYVSRAAAEREQAT